MKHLNWAWWTLVSAFLLLGLLIWQILVAADEKAKRVELETISGCGFVDVTVEVEGFCCVPDLIYVFRDGRQLVYGGGRQRTFYLHRGEYRIEVVYEIFGGPRRDTTVFIDSDTTIVFGEHQPE